MKKTPERSLFPVGVTPLKSGAGCGVGARERGGLWSRRLPQPARAAAMAWDPGLI
jgi:hypothetical protein